jgi:hypothetical protein
MTPAAWPSGWLVALVGADAVLIVPTS